MPVVSEPRSEPQNGPSVLKNNNNKKKETANKKNKKTVTEIPAEVARDNSSLDNSTCSSECSYGDCDDVKASATAKGSVRGEKVIQDRGGLGISHGVVSGPVKRCDWITPNSDPLYTCFHDEEWGVPVRDDTKLFELLVLSIALAEFTWPTILNKRHIFRKVFDNFDPSSIAKFTEKDISVFLSKGRTLLSKPKLRAVVENAKQILKIQQEFGSFSNYIWRFVNHKPIKNGYQFGRQIPVKTPKSELISKDLMKKGFRCVGPSVVYSFMQVTGLVNDHLVTCFRYQEYDNTVANDSKPNKDGTEGPNRQNGHRRGELTENC